jgi:hypothetical protein
MLELAIMVIDRLISLVKQRQETDRQLHDDFFVPLVADFEALHQNYLETFATYRSDIDGSAVPLSPSHPVLARISRDSLFTAQLRGRLLPLQEVKDDPVFADVVRAVLGYISTGEIAKTVLLEGEKPIPNAPRRRLAAGLTAIAAGDRPDDGKRADATALLDQIVMELQVAYKHFMEAAGRTKRRLLDRRLTT